MRRTLDSFLISHVLIIKLLVSIALLLTVAPALLPDEAQYWLWSQHLAWGYYSKPAGIAYMLYVVTAMLGDFAWAVRLPSTVLACASALCLYRVACGQQALSSVGAKWACVLFAFSPLALYGSFAATTDSGLLFSWCFILWAMDVKSPNRRALFLGVGAFVGMLFKPTIVALAFAHFARMDLPVRRRLLGGLWQLVGCGFALIGPFIWNLQHDWVTWRHMSTQLGLGTGSVSEYELLRPLQFLLTQALVASPILFIAALYQAVCVFKMRSQDRSHLWWQWHASIVFFVLTVSFLSCLKVKYQANWIAFIFPHLFLLVGRFWQSLTPSRAKRLGMAHCLIHTSLFLLMIYISWAQRHPPAPLSHSSFALNPFRSAMGWDRDLTLKLEKLGYEPATTFLVSDKYQTVSQLAFYSLHSDVYWFNLHGARKNQFSFWPVDAKWKGQRALFLAVENGSVEVISEGISLYLERMSPFFKSIEAYGIEPFFQIGEKTVRSLIWVRASGYLGTRPRDPKQY